MTDYGPVAIMGNRPLFVINGVGIVKRWLKMLAVLLVAGLLTGCGSNEDLRKYQDAEKPQSGDK